MFVIVGVTLLSVSGEVDLAELDGPFVKIRLKGRFWHKRTTVVDRISNYLKNRIPVSNLQSTSGYDVSHLLTSH